MEMLKRLITEEEGQDVVEYTLMIGLVVLVIWIAVSATGIDATVSTIWSKVKSSLTATGS